MVMFCFDFRYHFIGIPVLIYDNLQFGITISARAWEYKELQNRLSIDDGLFFYPKIWKRESDIFVYYSDLTKDHQSDSISITRKYCI